MQGINSKLHGRPIKAKLMGKARRSEKMLDRSSLLIRENGHGELASEAEALADMHVLSFSV
ncbi:hypothetical protein PAAG_02781 [Paracoccidioides lutzii Pb01]|uniref:Uncharacterized protein n=1 Tax=Paracoccidioides lutzii (strain ATCC MYA-826 / Pb01) TaxID=502779 RepID=C1GW86_PARBA|nr:hypothetical protein PAAG_02781 [Paracoccidioides lutzii Pb01]EEH40805.2 hypothetical protein PAAG_02781 [Paracoccidioides lutzii Pb01]